MILLFPNLSTVQLALTTGAIPAAVALSPVEVDIDEHGAVRVRLAKPLSKELLPPLRRWGVRQLRGAQHRYSRRFRSWLQILPLVRAQPEPQITAQTPVLFDVPDAAELRNLVIEMLRLGNSRQAVRWLGTGAAGRALLQVLGPPYYSVLRTTEQQSEPRLLAYVERAARVWVELGYEHPLCERVRAPEGKLLLLAADREWELIADREFHPIDGLLDWHWPDESVDGRDLPPAERFSVPVRLLRSGSPLPAELWAFEEFGVDRLQELAETADDELLARLTFAVGEFQGRQIVVLRARPGRGAPPILGLDAAEFRPSRQLPNLFIPCEMRLDPPLGREALERLLHPDGDRVTWLAPQPEGGFIPRSLPALAFRPLSDWVAYVIDQDHQAIAAWIEAARFEFEPFVVADVLPCAPLRSPADPDPIAEPGPLVPAEQPAPAPLDNPFAGITETEHPEARAPVSLTDISGPGAVVDARVAACETAFLNSTAAPDSDERHALWRGLAEACQTAGDLESAAVCWRQVVWLGEPHSARETGAWDAWLQAETNGQGPLTDRESAAFATAEVPTLLQLKRLLAHLLQQQSAGVLPELPLGRLQHLLEQWEPLLPVQLTWLAWLAVERLAGGDVLALARARDRLLARLHEFGLRSELELPACLRRSDIQESEPAAALRKRLSYFRALFDFWNNARPHGGAPETQAYVELLFAYGFARAASVEIAAERTAAALAALGSSDAAHDWLGAAFAFRIAHAGDSERPLEWPLALRHRLEQMERGGRYLVDRMRQSSRILEPAEHVDAYRSWLRESADELGRRLSALDRIHDPEELARQLREIVAAPRSAAEQARVLPAALELAPRIGAAAAAELLGHVQTVLTPVATPGVRAQILERALATAAHFGQPGMVQAFLGEFHQLLASPQSLDAWEAGERVLARSMRIWRRLGLQAEMVGLLDLLDAAAERLADRGDRLRLQLRVAAGRLDCRQPQRAWPVIDEARAVLETASLPPARQTALACGYLAALGHAPLATAEERLDVLFQNLAGIADNASTNSHFSRPRLQLAEALVLALTAITTEGHAAGGRWLEEAEFLVRRRIHRDFHAALPDAT